MGMNRALMNFIAFQTCWFACVLGAAAGMPYLGPAFAAIWLPVHILATKSWFLVELKLILVAGVVGYLLDSILVLGGWMSFPAHTQLGAPSTLWMVTLWLGFAATLRHALGWLRGHYVLGALLGALLGPFAYWSGSKLGAVVLTDTVPSLLAVGVEWLVAMPLLLIVAAHLERSRTDCKADDAAPLLREECP
jgi:hypothetical protein